MKKTKVQQDAIVDMKLVLEQVASPVLLISNWANISDATGQICTANLRGSFRYSRYTVACEPRLACLVTLIWPRAIQWRHPCFCRLYALRMSYRGQMKAFPHFAWMTIFPNDYNAE